ncbi:hypothetical protein HN924_01910 [Candidatus Woesearchaeota archaeon]|jgi:DNA-binding response OmpR family regulator|nr:hypothetical protein [Candidatus Woesearchaeota archaeon]MBT7062703.1 hypothetical protein [Candidatus Woesearchaeota archaeon]MBT7402464.1 hypothetical protein [Candidatus Woesearchaeota archaeon]
MVKIAIAEESTIVGINLKRTLEREGLDVTRVKKVEDCKSDYDLAIISQTMDEIGKFGEAFDEKNIPVVYLTTRHLPAKFKERTPFAKLYLPKPINPTEFKQTINDILSQ